MIPDAAVDVLIWLMGGAGAWAIVAAIMLGHVEPVSTFVFIGLALLTFISAVVMGAGSKP